MAKLHYSNNPIEKKEHVRRQTLRYKVEKRLLFISLAANIGLLAYVIINKGF